MKRIPDEDLLTDLHVVAADLDHAPSMGEYEDHGEYSARTIINRFGGWHDGLEAAGLERDIEAAQGRKVPDKKLLTELARIARALGHPPSRTEYDEHGSHASNTVVNHFDSWEAALRQAGVDPDGHGAIAPKPSASDDTTTVRCPYCGHGFRTQTAPQNVVRCLDGDCGRKFSWRLGLVSQAADHEGVQRLADGPALTSELPTGPRTGYYPLPKEYLLRLTDPRGKGKVNDAVYYLPGDVRAAARRYVDEYYDYVEKCVVAPDGENEIRRAWSAEQYDILVEQFLWRKHGRGNAHDAQTDAHDAQEESVGGDA